MPRESILLESASTKELINIKTPPKISYVEKRNLLKCHKQSTSHIKFRERREIISFQLRIQRREIYVGNIKKRRGFKKIRN